MLRRFRIQAQAPFGPIWGAASLARSRQRQICERSSSIWQDLLYQRLSGTCGRRLSHTRPSVACMLTTRSIGCMSVRTIPEHGDPGNNAPTELRWEARASSASLPRQHCAIGLGFDRGAVVRHAEPLGSIVPMSLPASIVFPAIMGGELTVSPSQCW